MQAGAPAILIGPGNFEVAYAYDEWADIEEIIDATKIYALAAMSWCGYCVVKPPRLDLNCCARDNLHQVEITPVGTPITGMGGATSRYVPFTGF